MLRAGDIIVTQWGGIALMTYPHAMLVTDVDGPEIEVVHMVASGFRTYYYYAPLQVLTAKKAKRMKIDMEHDTDVVIRWRGNPEVITQVIHTAHALKGKPIAYSTFAAACSVFGGDCFVDREEAEAAIPSLDSLEASFCSELIFAIWGNVLKNIGAMSGTDLLGEALPVNPSYCHPAQLVELPERFPDYWERINVIDPRNRNREFRPSKKKKKSGKPKIRRSKKSEK